MYVRPGTKVRIWVYFFALLMASMFGIFLARLPVRTAYPQPLRLWYYACQNGIKGGPLSSSLRDFDWKKAFVWRASDTEYRQRQFSQLVETLTARLYTHLCYWFGPFMWLPLSLLNAFLIGFMIAFVARQWCGNWLPGLVAASFWLLTPEVLVGHHAPVRYAKDFATLEMLGMISLLLALRQPGRVRLWLAGPAIVVIWGVGLFTDEYIPFLLPAFAAAILSWPGLKKCRWQILILLLLLTAISFWLFFSVLPNFISPDIRPAFTELKLRKMPELKVLVKRNFNYLIANTLDNFAYTLGFGWPYLRSLPQLLLAGGASLFLLVIGLVVRAGKGTARMVLFWLMAVIFAAGVLLPEGRDILHQITYYNRPLIALMMVILGLVTARVLPSGRSCLSGAWLASLTVIAGLNFYLVAVGLRNDPDEADLTRYGLDNILQLHDRLRSGELPPPVYVSYPRFRNVQSGVYDELESTPPWTMENGFPWSLYRALMPRLYLRHFEKGQLRANPRQFSEWMDADEHEYRAAANCLYDMPRGTAWNLISIRENSYSPDFGLKWTSGAGAVKEARSVSDLLGEVFYTPLMAGSWCTTFSIPADKVSPVLVFALRHQGPTVFTVSNACGAEEIECKYGWSFQLFTVELKSGADGVRLCVKTEGEAEVIGPVVVSSPGVAPLPLSLRKNVPPAGIPPLDLRKGSIERPGCLQKFISIMDSEPTVFSLKIITSF